MRARSNPYGQTQQQQFPQVQQPQLMPQLGQGASQFQPYQFQSSQFQQQQQMAPMLQPTQNQPPQQFAHTSGAQTGGGKGQGGVHRGMNNPRLKLSDGSMGCFFAAGDGVSALVPPQACRRGTSCFNCNHAESAFRKGKPYTMADFVDQQYATSCYERNTKGGKKGV